MRYPVAIETEPKKFEAHIFRDVQQFETWRKANPDGRVIHRAFVAMSGGKVVREIDHREEERASC